MVWVPAGLQRHIHVLLTIGFLVRLALLACIRQITEAASEHRFGRRKIDWLQPFSSAELRTTRSIRHTDISTFLHRLAVKGYLDTKCF